MAIIYAMSDMHEELELFKEALGIINLNEDTKLILLGDYINMNLNIKEQDFSILYFIKELQDRYKEKVIVIAGNHEFMLLEDIESKASSFNDPTIVTWLKDLPYYFETETQIFVHAGVDEEVGEFWKWGAEDYYFCTKYPHTTGKFYKDIIAGHIHTSQITGMPDYNKVYFDKESHYYIDGNTRMSKTIPVLKYNTDSGKYSGFEKFHQTDGGFVWQEYAIK